MSDRNEAVIGFLTARRSTPVLQLAEPGPSREELGTILRLAARVPDHGKLSPWRFVVYAGTARDDVGEGLAEIVQADDPSASEERLALERSRFTRAPLVVGVISCAAVHPKVPVWEQVMSAGATCYNMVLAANAFGYGATWLSEWYAFDERAFPLLGVGAEEKVAGFIHIGTRTEPPFERVRPDMDAIVTWRGEI
ncbi:nitroreductase [Martelella alba]|uniref:Putative NAD(P)H nitroreductase n=1 Tax=Martelella alba TaxID=2590451 RepID=A0A506U9S5_9HYPH|nr:nitroreductase [Martelella alba]TPW29824.1 nitroreductase [Martelella alba]